MNYKGKTIEVQRYFNMVEMAQEDPEVKAWLGQAYRGIGPYWYNKTAGSGLTFSEQKILLPIVLGIETSDKGFRQAVTNYYHSFNTRVPKEGVKLQVSLDDDQQPLSETNLPINVQDYLTYRHIIGNPEEGIVGHPQVASSKIAAEKQYTAKFYLVDTEGLTQETMSVNSLEDTAMSLYMQYKDDSIKLDQILTMMGVNITNLKTDAKVIKFKQLAQKNVKLNTEQQKEQFNLFIKTAQDRDLEYKYLIQEMIGAQYLKRVGNNILYGESGKQIGENMEDTVLYFKSPKNSRELNLLKAEYILKVKPKGANYIPKDNPIPKFNNTPEDLTYQPLLKETE